MSQEDLRGKNIHIPSSVDVDKIATAHRKWASQIRQYLDQLPININPDTKIALNSYSFNRRYMPYSQYAIRTVEARRQTTDNRDHFYIAFTAEKGEGEFFDPEDPTQEKDIKDKVHLTAVDEDPYSPKFRLSVSSYGEDLSTSPLWGKFPLVEEVVGTDERSVVFNIPINSEPGVPPRAYMDFLYTAGVPAAYAELLANAKTWQLLGEKLAKGTVPNEVKEKGIVNLMFNYLWKHDEFDEKWISFIDGVLLLVAEGVDLLRQPPVEEDVPAGKAITRRASWSFGGMEGTKVGEGAHLKAIIGSQLEVGAESEIDVTVITKSGSGRFGDNTVIRRLYVDDFGRVELGKNTQALSIIVGQNVNFNIPTPEVLQNTETGKLPKGKIDDIQRRMNKLESHYSIGDGKNTNIVFKP